MIEETVSQKPKPAAKAPAASAATPLMQQYLSLKEKFQEEVLFFRLGDFYEMFFEDAVRAAPILEVALTQRQGVPMCGIPHHAMTSYLSKLLKAGLSVAVAEQLEDPKKTKGMVKRDVVRIMTPGTLIEDDLLPSRANNFLVAVAVLPNGKTKQGSWALAAADVSTGQQWAGSCDDDLHWNNLRAQLTSLNPSEILVVGDASKAHFDLSSTRAVVRFEPVPSGASDLADQPLKAIRNYLTRDRVSAAQSLSEPRPLPAETSGTLFLDETAIRHLELVNSADPLRPGPTLLSVLDRCVTAMGSRLLRWWLLHPSTRKEIIEGRLDQVEDLFNSSALREEIRNALKQVADIERISVRAQNGAVSPRDLEALRHSLVQLPWIQKLLSRLEQDSLRNRFSKLVDELTVSPELPAALQLQLADAPPAKLADGGVIRDGFNAELDELRRLRRSGKSWIAEMEAKEREATGIGSLKVGYNDVFGYYLEVSKSNLSKVPPEWIRKQTLANGERFITPPLKEQEEKILGAEEKIRQLEAALFSELAHQVATHAPSLAKVAEALARLDTLGALAQAAVENNYTRPQIQEDDELVIRGGRHPVIERQIGRSKFIPNDVGLDADKSRIAVITGPNMAGKSTYLRQTALIVILAQMGSFVPAESAVIGIVDKIFTRIGASDRLSQGQSTFMVEMQEVATLLLNSTSKSLLVLDEVGRGTSTYDGISIAWAVIEYLAQGNSSMNGRRPLDFPVRPENLERLGNWPAGPRTLFATHYFELTQLADKLPGVFNAHATAKEWPGPDGVKQVVFLYQILPGPADRSYGIHVAEMAGLPVDCIKRAREILKQLESGSHNLAGRPSSPSFNQQMELFAEHPALADLRAINVNEMTPVQALNCLAELRKKVGDELS